MNDAILRHFKDSLETQRNAIVAKQQKQKLALELAQDDRPDEYDLCRTTMEQNMQLRLHIRENLYLKKLEATLKRIQDGAFGYCMECEEEIDLGRLKARPTTCLCIPCKEAQEHSERGFIDQRRGNQQASGRGNLLRIAQ